MKHLAGAVAIGIALVALATTARADDRSDLIALDKAWGAAGIKNDTAAMSKLLADGLLSVSEDGVTDKKGDLAVANAPAGATYQPTDFKIVFLNPDTAVMTHGTEGEGAHYSLHVWVRKGGTWQVVATSSTPAAHK